MTTLRVIEQKERPRLPAWFKVRFHHGPNYAEIRRLVTERGLHTVCEEARCPNIWECWNDRTATFMILGDICTRSCGFCAVKTGRPTGPDLDEPRRVAEAVRVLGLGHAVVTSVNRDELPDGGAEIFGRTIEWVRSMNPGTTIEVLVPDFRGDPRSVLRILRAAPDIFSHNVETVPRLYASVRPQAKYPRSLDVLRMARVWGAASRIRIKTGLMLGLGETIEEVVDVMKDLRSVGVEILALGQYLQPTPRHLAVTRYLHPDEFSALRSEGLALGFHHVESGPRVRSSYHAERQVVRRARGETVVGASLRPGE